MITKTKDSRSLRPSFSVRRPLRLQPTLMPTLIGIVASRPISERRSAQQPRGQLTRGQLIEGRNVGVGFEHSVPANRSTGIERNSVDFNS